MKLFTEIDPGKIFIVEQHHEVLLPWAQFRRNNPLIFPRVYVLDHHTDVLPAFRDPDFPVRKDCWREPDTVENAVQNLRHDEHFNWAVRAGLVSGCLISSCVNSTLPSLPELEVVWDERWQDENAVFADPEKFRFLADSVLETSYLSARFGAVPQEPFILDIDCDCFATWKSFHPGDRSYFEIMAEKACIITVSLERDWVRLLRFPGESFTAETIPEELFHLRSPAGDEK